MGKSRSLCDPEATGPLACVQGGSFPSGSRPPTEPLLSAQISFVPAHTSGSFPLQSLLQPLPTCKAFSVLSSVSPKGSLPSLSSIQAGGLYPTFFPRSQVRACLSFLVYNQELLAVGPTQSTFVSLVSTVYLNRVVAGAGLKGSHIGLGLQRWRRGLGHPVDQLPSRGM